MLRSIVATLLVGLAAFLIWALLLFNDNELARHSFDKSQRISADFRAIGQFTESYRNRSGQIPDSKVLDDWFKKQHFKEIAYTPGLGAPVFVVDGNNGCSGAGEPDDQDFWNVAKDTYVLCYWRGEWYEAYSPQLDRSTLPKSLSDYRLGLLDWLLVASMAIALCVIAGSVAMGRPKRGAL